MASLVLQCLGGPRCFTGSGRPVRFRTRKHLALLIRLAVEPGRPLSRAYLSDLLWPAAAAPRAAHSLSQAVSVVRAQVGREHIQVQRAGVALARDAVAVDVLQLESGDVEVAGGFLDGFEIPRTRPFEEWTDEWRARLLPRLRDSLVRRMDAGRRRGDFTTVERYAAVLSDLDPLSEDAVRGTIEARAWVGDRSSALRAYAAYTERLAEGLGAKPSADLTRMAELLRAGRPPAPRSVGEPGPRTETRVEPEPLIGREREFTALSDAWRAARQRIPQVVVVLGDPGLGKTTLANAFASTCQLEGAVVARAQAYDAERELPFVVLAELVRQLALQRAIGCAEPEALSELSRLTPEVAITFPGVPTPVQWTPDVMPLRLADAFLRTITAAADEGPVVIVVDDIHAADNASVAILHAVARKLPPGRLMMILAARPGELGVSGAAALTRDVRVEGLRTLELEPLTAEASGALVDRAAHTAGAQVGDLPRERILDAGRGNPLALSLLAREWAAHGPDSLLHDLEAVNTRPVAVPGIPRAIKAVFERQVARLHPRTRAVLDLAAVLGRRLADLTLYQAAECTPTEAAESLARLRDEGLIREIQGGLEFRNELIRAQAYYAVPAPVRQHLHRRVGELLEMVREDGESSALESAWHFLRGADATRALSAGWRGIENALNAGAPVEAEKVSAALLASKDWSAGTRSELLHVHAKALLAQSKAHVAIPILEELGTATIADARLAAEISYMRAAAEYLTNQEGGTGYGRYASIALEHARRLGDAELIVRALLETARAAQETGDEATVRTASTELDQLVTQPEFAKLPQTHHALGFCAGILHENSAKLAHYQRYTQLLQQSASIADLPLAYNGRGISKYALCDLEGAALDLAVALEFAHRMGDDSRISLIAGNACSVETARGRYEAAETFGRLSVRAGTKALSQPFLVGAYTNLIDVLMLTDRHREAEDILERAQAWSSQNRRWAARVFFLCERASLALMARDTSLALQLARRVDDLSRGRREAVLQPGLLVKLRVLLSAFERSPQEAFDIVRDATARFERRHPLLYLDVLAARVWLERRVNGRADDWTTKQIEGYANAGLLGKIKLLHLQGFLE